MKKQIKYYHYFIIAILFAGISILVWHLSFYAQPSSGYGVYTKFISERVNREIDISERELTEVVKEFSKDKNEFSSLLQMKLKYPVYIYHNGDLVYWSEYKFVPKYNLLLGKEENRYVQLAIGKFIINKKNIDSGWEIFSCIPLSYEYSITNNYIQSGLNEEIFTQKNIEISNFISSGSYNVFNEYGKYLFSLDFLSVNNIVSDTTLYTILILSILSIFFLLIYVFKIVNTIVKSGKIILAAVVLFFSLVSIRGLMLYLHYPYCIVELNLFDSKYFASSEISPSLGDLLLNILFFSFFSSFVLVNYYKIGLIRKLIVRRQKLRFFYGVLLSIISIVLLFYLSYVYSEVYSNSQFSLDISESIDVNFFKATSLLIFILVSGIYFIYNHIILRLYILLVGNNKSVTTFIPIFIVSLIFEIIMILIGEDNWIFIPVNLAYWLLLIFFSLPRSLGTLKYSTYLYFLFAAFICSFT